MRVVKATDIFTPTKRPTFTSVRRAEVWEELEGYVEQGGGFVSLLGTTKLGKSTLIEGALDTSIFGVSIPGQALVSGVDALWRRLVDALGIHTSATTGMVNSRGIELAVAARIGVKDVGEGEIGLKGSKGKSASSTKEYVIDPAKAVQDAFSLIAAATDDNQNPPIIAIDDFHFITDPSVRRELILALRPIAEGNVTVILATLPGREDDDAFEGTNVGGRHYVVPVPRWREHDLRAIADAGFKELNATVPKPVIDRLIAESLGSPQLMQQLCLNLCRVNAVKVKVNGAAVGLSEPTDWTEFFRRVRDPQSVSWLKRLGLGLTQRRPRNRYALIAGNELDAYQLILQALHEAGTSESSLAALKARIGSMLDKSQSEVSKMNLDQIAKNMNVVASRDMTDALRASTDEGSTETVDESALFSAEEIRLATRVPQPVFEVIGEKGSDLTVRVLDPLLEYTLKWHPEAFATRTA